MTTTDVDKVREALTKHPGGLKLSAMLRIVDLTESRVKEAVNALRAAGEVETAAEYGARLTRTAEAKREPGAPKPKTLTREPADRWEHFRAIQRAKGLSAAARWVAAVMSNEVYANGGGPREMTPEWLGRYRANMSSRQVREHQSRLVEAGLFRRIDNGKGGRRRGNGATFTATVPQWFGSKVAE